MGGVLAIGTPAVAPKPVESLQDGLPGKTACVEFAINSQKVLLNQLNNFQSRLEPLIVLLSCLAHQLRGTE